VGAHLDGDDEAATIGGLAATLDPDLFQFHEEAGTGGVYSDETRTNTRVVDGACIFLNRPGFAAGEGCALHLLALQDGRSFVETKPDVCWQLPLRRQFRTVTRGDQTTYTEVTLGEYVREGWGAGGHDLDWYCTSNTEAHIGSQPVYLANTDELVELMGRKAYAVLAELCAEFEANPGTLLRHPATVQADATRR
jgi:hypothetical protein